MNERVIVPDVKEHQVSLADATLAYVGATSSNVNFMLPENEQMAKNL